MNCLDRRLLGFAALVMTAAFAGACGGESAPAGTPTGVASPADASVDLDACLDACAVRPPQKSSKLAWCDPFVGDDGMRHGMSCVELCSSYYPALDGVRQNAMVSCLKHDPLCYLALDKCIEEPL